MKRLFLFVAIAASLAVCAIPAHAQAMLSVKQAIADAHHYLNFENGSKTEADIFGAGEFMGFALMDIFRITVTTR